MTHTNPGPWSAQSMAHLPPLQSQPVCRQDRVVANGADAVFGRQAAERHSSIKDRLRQMEAQLEEENKELQRVPMLTGRRPLGGRRGLGRGQCCLSLPLPSLPPSVCMCETEGMAPRCGTCLLGRGAGVPHAKLLVETWCVCRMAVPRQEENSSCTVTEGVSGKGDDGGSHHQVLREVSRKGWPHSDTDHPGNRVGIPGPASRVSTVPTMPVFLALDCRASQAGSQGAVVLTPIVRPVVRRPHRLGRELSVSRSGVHFLTFRTAAQRLLKSGCCL